MDYYADQGADSVNNCVFNFEAVTVRDDFGGFMDGANYCYQSRNVQCRVLLPAKAEGEGNQGVGSNMRHPVYGAGKGMSGGRHAADGEQAEREQHGYGAGEQGVRLQEG